MKVQVWGCVLSGAVGFLLCSGAVAAPLDAAACDQLRQELATVEKSPARANFLKGPAWAKANLKPDQLAAVEKLIETEQQFLFRCPQPKRQLDAATEQIMENGTGSDPDPDAPKPPASEGATPAAPKAKAVKKAAAAAPSEPDTAGKADEPAAPKPKAKRAPRPKADDAYQPEAKKSE